MSKSAKSKNTEEKQVQSQTQSKLPAHLTDPGAWVEEQIDSEDLSLPTIRLLQGLSKLVTTGVGIPGEFRNTFDKNRKLGDPKSPLQIIPFGTFKTWVIRVNGDFHKIVPVTPENIGWEWEELDKDENVIKREKWFNVYCLTPGDVERGEAFPAVISFKGMSYKAAKNFATLVKKLQTFKQPMASRVFEISCEADKNEKGSFFKLSEVALGRETTVKEMEAAHKWHVALVKEKTKVNVNYEETEQAEETVKDDVPAQAKTQEGVAAVTV